MRRARALTAVVAIVASLVLMLGPAPAAEAQAITHAISLSYWPSYFLLTVPGSPNVTWNTGFIVLDYRGTFGQWGVRLRGGWGSSTNHASGGTPVPGVTGNDTFWSGDIFYNFAMNGFVIQPFAGYGSSSLYINQSGSWTRFEWTGFRVGADAMVMVADNLTLVGGAAWQPSVNFTGTSSGGGTPLTGTGSAIEWNAALQYAFNSNLMAQVGYRSMGGSFVAPSTSCTTGAPCTYGWTGFYVGLGYRY